MTSTVDKKPTVDINEILKLLNLLLSSNIDRQIYTKEIKMLFKMLDYQSFPMVIVSGKPFEDIVL